MRRVEIEIRLNRDRAWLLEKLSALPAEVLVLDATASEHDPALSWSLADHFVHTTLIERNWNAMIRRHVAGGEGMARPVSATMTESERADLMAGVHRWTEEWATRHRGKPFEELVRIGLETRSDTLKLLSELTDDQLASVIPGAPWADGTVGGILAANADHGRLHYRYAKEGLLARGLDLA